MVLKEHFFHQGSYDLLAKLDEASRRSGTSRGQTFEDFLEVAVCALSGGQMEEQYLRVAQRHSGGEPGRRGIDTLSELFADLVRVMEETRADILGDLFMGAITFGEHGQFYTPETVTDMMAKMAGPEGKTVCDPCCGSGRMLLSAAKENAHRLFVGQDIDVRCVRMTTVNLALRNLYGYVILGNSLANEQRLIYQTGFNGKGFVREIPVAEVPPVVAEAVRRAPQSEKPDQRTLFGEGA